MEGFCFTRTQILKNKFTLISIFIYLSNKTYIFYSNFEKIYFVILICYNIHFVGFSIWDIKSLVLVIRSENLVNSTSSELKE